VARQADMRLKQWTVSVRRTFVQTSAQEGTLDAPCGSSWTVLIWLGAFNVLPALPV